MWQLGRRLETRRSLLLPHNDAVEAFGEGGAEGVDDGAGRAGAGDVVEEDLPAVLGEVFAVFHPVGLAGDGGELEVHSVGGGLEGGNVGLARGVERVGAAGAPSEVEGARSSAVPGMPLAHFQPPLFPSSASAVGVKLQLASNEFGRIATTMSAQEVIAEFKELPPAERDRKSTRLNSSHG